MASWPPDGSVERFLKRPDWPEIGNLHGYLSITHFLGQASTRRFSLRKPKSQWKALKGPAGVDRINILRERVSGQGARQAFTRAIRERGRNLEKASGLRNVWRTLVGRIVPGSARPHPTRAGSKAPRTRQLGCRGGEYFEIDIG